MSGTGRAGPSASLAALADPFQPSEHTAAMLLHLRRRFATRSPGRVVEVGTGSGVLLALLLRVGATEALGVDIDPAGVARTAELLGREGLSDRAEVAQGSMWEPCQGRRFDLAVANLPHFPATAIEGDLRPSTWSCGGVDGRRWLDEFLTGLPDHLTPSGSAVITHNAFVDLDRTRMLVGAHGLVVDVVHTASVLIPEAKLASISPGVLERHGGQSIYRIGNYAFGDFHVLELRQPGHA